MDAPPLEMILKRFDKPDEARTFPKGRFEIVTIGEMTIGRASYEPGVEMERTCGRVE